MIQNEIQILNVRKSLCYFRRYVNPKQPFNSIQFNSKAYMEYYVGKKPS